MPHNQEMLRVYYIAVVRVDLVRDREKEEWRMTPNCLVSVNSRASSWQQRKVGSRAGQEP